jgi:thymidylate synthase (FAD)
MGSDLTVVNAARVSYAAESKEFSDRDAGLIKFLAEHNHVTPFRHPQIQVRCRAPIFLARQLGKHQAGFSWNELSRRYKDGEAIAVECYIPEKVLARPENLMKLPAQDVIAKDVQMDMKFWIRNAYNTAVREYGALIELGVAPEQARMVLPQGMITEWIWTGSLYGFASLYNQRSTEHAQYEAQLFAEEIHQIMSKLYPVCWEALTNKD